jgi:hypothetical protein
MTVATEIYATGVHPYNQQPVCVAKTPEAKQEQRSFFFWYKPEMKSALRSTLSRLGMKEAAAKLLGGDSAKFQMIGESDYAKVKPARQIQGESVADKPAVHHSHPRATKPWFKGSKKK